MYDYVYTLPTPVTLQGGIKFWFRVVAGQPAGSILYFQAWTADPAALVGWSSSNAVSSTTP